MQQQQMNPQQAQQQRAQAYVQQVLSDLEKDPGALNPTERQFGSKYAETYKRVRQIESDLTQLREQIRQGEARVKSLELQHQSEAGRATAFLESLVSLKFEVEAEASFPTLQNDPKDGDNGAQKPSVRAVVPPVAQA